MKNKNILKFLKNVFAEECNSLINEINEFKNIKNKTGYDYLKFMCKHVRNKSSAFNSSGGHMTDRVTFIIDSLNELDIDYKIIPFTFSNVSTVGYGKSKLANVQVFFKATKRTKKTLIFTAHHDIANPNSENCQDNSASVCNLIHLCSELKKMKIRNRNIYIVFTDCEEIGGRGAEKLCEMIKDGKLGEMKLEGIIGLEITARGTELWTENISKKHSPIVKNILKLKNEKVEQFRTPYNECVTIRSHGIDSVCVGILPPKDVRMLKNDKFSPNWSLCHSHHDTFELSAVKKDMNRFVKFLKILVNE